MNARDQARYRLQLAEGFLEEARQDGTLGRWRSCVDNSQLATEQAAKAALGLVGPVGRTHKPSVFLRRALAEDRFLPEAREQVVRLAECAELLGPETHVKSDYGDEENLRLPWDLFGEQDARQALGLAEEAVNLAKKIASGGPQP